AEARGLQCVERDAALLHRVSVAPVVARVDRVHDPLSPYGGGLGPLRRKPQLGDDRVAVPDALEHREPLLLRYLELKRKLLPDRHDVNARRIAWILREAERMRDEGHHEHD